MGVGGEGGGLQVLPMPVRLLMFVVFVKAPLVLRPPFVSVCVCVHAGVMMGRSLLRMLPPFKFCWECVLDNRRSFVSLVWIGLCCPVVLCCLQGRIGCCCLAVLCCLQGRIHRRVPLSQPRHYVCSGCADRADEGEPEGKERVLYCFVCACVCGYWVYDLAATRSGISLILGIKAFFRRSS